ncbi:unnamed protein product, partial [Onchocerca flexuosa]|uniref:Transcriptional regulator n=1 Tax=Onchocerca flexuosa TaxID=387005 RepID=A0A183H722_9BILA
MPPEDLSLLTVGEYRKNRKEELPSRIPSLHPTVVIAGAAKNLCLNEIASTVSFSISTMKRKKSTLKGFCSGLYRVSAAANGSSLNDLETDGDGGVFLLNFEKLNREFY